MRRADRMTGVDKLQMLAEAGIGGADWYKQAHDWCKREARLHSVTLNRLIDVLAITSPRVSVAKNKRLAMQYLLWDDIRGMLPSTISALAHYEQTGEIRGPKTSAFAEAIRCAGMSRAVVLDVWMARALGVPQERLFLRANYDKAVERVNQVADRLMITPAQAQACIWSGTVLDYGYRLEARDL